MGTSPLPWEEAQQAQTSGAMRPPKAPPQTLPANFTGWDQPSGPPATLPPWEEAQQAQGPPQTLPADFNGWDQQSAPQQNPGAPMPRVTTSMNPKLNAAMAQRDASPAAGAVGLAGGALFAGEPVLGSAAGAQLARIGLKYGLRGLSQGAGAGLAWKLYKELDNFFSDK